MKIAQQSVEYVDHMGTELNIVNSARVSFDKKSEEFNERDAKLIQYLARHNHWSPFAHTSISLRVKAPIFVARQLVKHQVGGVWNEVSRRYVAAPPEFYFPEHRMAAVDKKQGSIDEVLGQEWEYTAKEHVKNLYAFYNHAIECGMAPEVARAYLPQNTMTEWIWTGSLLFFHRVYKQRIDPHAQKEAQEIAQMINDVVAPLFPNAWKALNENSSNP